LINIFILPSWYPSASSQISGIFVKEQIEAIADLEPNIQVIVSKWGHADGLLNVKRPWLWPKRLLWWLAQSRDVISEKNGVHEVFNPKITWTDRLPFGGVRQLIGVNRRNFKLAEKQFGKINLIHAHVSYPAGYVASQLAKENKIPFVLTEHMGPFPFKYMYNGVPLPEIEQAFRCAAASIAVSPSLAQRISSFGYPLPRVIPNLLDERVFTLGHSSSSKTVFFTLGSISKQKGIDDLLEAIAKWNPSADKYEFRIGGDGPQRVAYQTKAQALGIADRVQWLGPVSRAQVPALFNDCHIFVMPSHHESFSVVCAEAIASGKPLIATRCGGPEFIVNNQNGKLVNIGDVFALAQAMKTMAEEWEKYQPEVIRRDFERRFSRQVVVKQLIDLYWQVLKG
jgi:glycosyltransferase involved in cell wall biosynthesis